MFFRGAGTFFGRRWQILKDILDVTVQARRSRVFSIVVTAWSPRSLTLDDGA